MDKDLYAEAIEYELLTQKIYQAILHEEGATNIDVKHNVTVKGRSGVGHQIDVLWSFKLASIKHTVLIECKNYSSSLTLEKIRNFFAVTHDIGNAKGIIVTKTNYQSGAKRFADYYGLDLKLLRPPTGNDLEGRIKEIELKITTVSPISTKEKPISVNLFIAPVSKEQEKRINELLEQDNYNIPFSPNSTFLSAKGIPCTDEIRYWLPRELDVLDKYEGVCYLQNIELDKKYVYVNPGQPTEELVLVSGLEVNYYVETFDTKKIVIQSEEIVKAILKDYNTGDIEHVHKG